MKISSKNSRSRLLKTSTVLMFGVILMVIFPQSLRAQAIVWEPPEPEKTPLWIADGDNIYNANAGNVGVGTTTPGYQLDIMSTINIIARFGSSANAHSQVLITAPTGYNSNLTFQQGDVSQWYLGNRAANNRFSFIESTGVTEVFSILQSGRVGVGTVAPGFRFDVQGGQINASGGLCIAGDCKTAWSQVGGGGSSQWTTSGSSIYYNTGSVGIGTANPTRKLEVLAADGEALRLYRNSSNVGWGVNLKFALNNTSGTEVDYVGLHGVTASTTAGAESGHLVFTTVASGSLAERMRLTNIGSLGLGTSTPGYRLDVQGGQINSSGGLCMAGDCKTAWSQVGGGTSQWTTTGSNIYYSTGNVGIGNSNPLSTLQIGTQASGPSGSPVTLSLGGTYSNAAGTNFKLRLYDDGVTANLYGIGVSAGSMDFGVSPTAGYNWYSGGALKLALTGAGNVGIGTASPSAGLDIQPAIVANPTAFGVRMQQTLTAGPNYSELNGLYINPNFQDGQAVGVRHNALVTTAGNVGIGTSATAAGLDVQNTGSTTSGATFGARFQQVLPSAGNNATSTAVYINPNFNDGQAIGVRHNGLVVASGDVGIGTSTPSTKLHVVGDTTMTGNLNATGTITGGNIIAKYQDVAEWVESSQLLPAGTVVVLDRNKFNQVIACSTAYDTRVAGVISAQPGITLGEKGESKVLVATTGRVKVKVDATAGPIQVGDLLVTSDKEGLARKSEPVNLGGVQIHRPGTLIGKALEPLEKGIGEILVLLSLQ